MEKRLSLHSLALLRETAEEYHMMGDTKIATALELLLNWYDEEVKKNVSNPVSKG